MGDDHIPVGIQALPSSASYDVVPGAMHVRSAL